MWAVKPKIILLLAIVIAITWCSVPVTSSLASAEEAPTVGEPTFLGSLVAASDTPTRSFGRDGGVSVPLPNGKLFWVFADTPRWQFLAGSWRVTSFVYGSTAGIQSFRPGQRPTSKFLEVNVGRKLSAKNLPKQFMANPRLKRPDGTACRFGVRWPTGAALWHDKVNIFIPYVDVCVLSGTNYPIQGWGYAFYNWKTNRFTIGPRDVYKPNPNGNPMPLDHMFNTPVVVGNTLTMYSSTPGPEWGGYATTIPATVAALKDVGNAQRVQMSMPPTFQYRVAPPTMFVNEYTLYMSTDTAGGFQILSSPTPTGPWRERAKGTLPQCATSTWPCTSFAIHPEVSSPSELLLAYYVPGNGPTLAGHPNTHPERHPNFGHIVWASIPIQP